jgi:hypothetical protein
MKVLKALPEFQRMKEYYAPRHYNDHHLAIALQLFRETHSDKYPFDWFPEDSAGKGVFTRFMNHELKRVKLSQTSASMQRDDISRLYSTLYSTYTPEVLADRIGMLNDEFRKELDKIVAADKTGRSRQELLKAQGDGKDNGYVVIMNTVFNKLKRLYGNVEDMMNRYKAKYPDATEEELAEARRKSEYLSQEYNTVLANKERLAALAASSIGEGEGFIVNVRDFEISFEDVKDLNSPMEDVRNEDGTDADESSKGERYADFRIVKMMETLGPRARRLISRIAKTDATGNVVKDDLGRTRYLDSRQAAIGLTTALINSNPATMMDDLRAASDNNPWMKGVINELEKNPDKQTTVYCNFKKAATLFIYTNIEGNSYTPHIANSRSQGHALMRDAGSNVSAGYVLDEDTSIYVGYGSLRDADKIREIHKKFTELKDRIINGTQNIRMVKGDKKPKNVTQEYEKLEPVDAMKEFFRLNPDVPKQVSDYLRGLGYSITPDEVETISLQQMDPKSFGYVAGWKDWKATKGRNKLYRLVAWMDAAYERAEEIWKGTGPKTGQYFYNTCADEYRHIDNCIALAKYNEVEPRTNMDGKSMSAYNNVNLLHQIFDLLTNADHLEEGPGPGSYQERLENEFLRYEGMSLGYGADRRAIGWLKWLASGKYRQTDIREAMRVTDMPTFNHVEYAKLTRPQKLTNSLVQFFKASRMFSQGTEPFCAVEFPIQSDYSTAYNFCYCPKLSIDTFTDETKPVEEWNEPVSLVDSDLVEAIADEVLAETERIAAIEERVKNDKDGKNRPVLSVYERQGMKFQIFPEFNDNGFRQAYKERTNPNDARQFVKEQVAAQLEKIRQKDIETVEKEGILTNRYLRDLGVYSKDGKVSSLKESSRKKLDEWFYNTFYARLQMVKLWDGGLQNFDGLIDFEKRNMLLHATRTSLYTNATWNGKPVGKESENVMYVGDEVSESAFLKSILGMLKDLLDKELITPVQYRGMKKAYSKIKSTDGQGFRTLESYRDVMIMSDQWDDRHESAYQRIIAGKPLKGDIDVFMQNIKPVATGFEHIDAAEGKLQKPVKLTFLHKYSEAVLLPVALSKYCLSAQSVPLRAFDAAQAELKKQGKPVDLFLFHSGAKVGAHSLVKPLMRWSDFKDDEERKAHGWKGQKLNEHILKDEKSITDYLVSSVKANKWSIHTIPYKYYGIAAATPPHGVDDKIARASQKEKTVWANIQPGDMIEVNGVPMLATEARDLYYKLKSANIVEAYKKIREVFTDTDQLERIFKEELANKSYQPQELKFALTHLADGTFALPMFSPNVAHQVQELLASIIKKRMTKIKTKGANILVTTAVGMEADVDPYMGGFPESYKLGVEFQGEGKNQRLKWFDAGLPLPEALREFANADGEITPEMLWGYEDKDGNHIKGLVENGIIPMEALLFDASRTPSDAEHSTVPCRVKWFSSRLEGSNMKVAKEAMVTTGQDFDGDKLRADFPEYDVVWDEDKLNEEYDRLLGLGTDAGAANLAIGNIKDKDVNAALNGFKKWREAVINGDIPGGSKFRKVRVVSYDSSKSPLENSARARHNMMIALTRGQLTSVEGSRRVLIPGGCEESKIYAKTLHLVRLAKDPTLKKKICDTMVLDTKYGGLGLENEKAAKAFGSVVGMYEVLTDLYDDDLTVLVRAVSNADTPYTLTHSLDAYDYLMGGAEMIGIYALYNSAQQMLQRLDMEYVPSENAEGYRTVINLFGKPIKELFSVENREGTFASLGLARLLNAAVDNGKDPILGYLNQTKEMAEMTSFLFAAGIDEEQVHLIMNQPVVIELINRLKGRDSEGLRKEAEKLVEELQSQFNDKRVSFSDAIEKAGAMKEEDYIGTLQMSLEEIKNSQDIPLINQQTGILYILSHLSSGAKTLADFIRLTRPESDSGSIGSSISDIILKHIALEDFREKLAKNPDSSIHISGMRDVLKKRDVHEGWDPKFIMEQLGDKLTEVVALNSLMMDSSLDMFKEYFPQARADWIGTARKIFKMYHVNSKDAKRSIIEHITQEMILWKLLDNEKFIQGDPQEEQKRIIVDVPHDLRMLKKRIENAKQNPGKDPAAEALIDNAFLDKFTTTSPEETKDRPRILFSLNGPAVEGMADSIRAYWGEMLQSSDESVRKLAVDLFKYNMYTSGFGYGMYEFAHFAPFSVLMETPGYIDALREVQRSTWTSDSVEEENFINQYILNHWGDSKFLLNVTDKTFPIGVDSITRELNPQLYDRIKDERYIILNAGDPDHRTQILYRLDKDRNGAIHPVVAEKLGVRLQGNQVTLQYNPRLNFWEVHPIVAGNDSAWGVRDDVEENHFAESNYEAGLENSTYTHGYVNSIGAVRNGEVDKTKIGTGFAASLGLIPTQQEANSMEELEQKAEAASQQNGQMDETPPPLTAEDEILANYTPMMGLGFAGVDMAALEKAKVGANPEAETTVKKGNYLSIARRQPDGKIKTERVPATPANIREARKQRVYSRLNARLREILREKGVAVGALNELEARMSLAGVTDFDTAMVTAEGLKEMIRIAEGYLGESALPEEFAHFGIEMIGHDNPLVKRLLDVLNNNDDALREAFEGQYDDYVKSYGNDREKLVTEAAGKLVAKQMFRQEEIRTSPVRRILQRVVDAIKSFLRRFRRDEIQNAIFEANDIASKIGRELLGGKILDDKTLQDINRNGQLYAKAEKVKKNLDGKEDVLHRILKNELKRLDILQRRIGYDKEKMRESKSIAAVELQIKKLENSIKNYKTEDAIITYMNDSLDFLTKTQEKLTSDIDSGKYKANEICRKLNMVRDTLYGFSAVLDDVSKAIAEGEVKDSVGLSQAINETAGVLRRFFEYYNMQAMHYFKEMLSNVYGEHGVTIDIGKEKGRVITIDEMAHRADRDISLASRWFHAIADCNDYALNAIDDLTRSAKYKARSRTLSIKPRIEKAVAELIKETGSNDQSWMFEWKRYDGGKWCDGRQDDGKLHKSGEYITEDKAKELGGAKYRFYQTMMEIKKDADGYLPDSLTGERKIVMLRKYTWDRVKESEGIKQKTMEVWEGVRNSILDTSSSIDYDNYEIRVDFEGNQVDMLPVNYLAKGKNESFDDMIDDVAASILAYAGMAYEYGELNNVIGILENAKFMSSQREVGQHAGKKTKRETIETENAIFHNPFTKKQAETNIAAALEDFFQMHIYGHIQANEGTIGNTKISKRKAVDTLNAITSYSQMAVNIPQRIANISVGLTQILFETVGAKTFSIADTKWALGLYMKESGDRLAETGKTDYDNKLSLWLDKFDVHQDNGRKYKNLSYKRSRLSKIFNSSLLYAGLTMGEDLLASTTALSVARNFKMRGPYGEDANLWDAYEVKYTDPARKTGAYLQLKDGYTKADGSALTQDDEIKFAKAVAGLNFELQGIYNLDDRSAVQQYALGALLIMYRKWIAPSLKRRYAGVHYNALKGRHEEGYHATMFRLLHDIVVSTKEQVSEEESAKSMLNIVDDLKALRTSISLNWNKMNDYEKSNVHRSMIELATVVGLYLACALLGKIPPPEYEGDDRGKVLKWWDQTVMSQMLRLRTEIGAMAPTPMLVDEAMHILKSPFAAIEPLTNTINAFQLLVPSNYMQTVKSGRYRGHKKAYKYFRELPIISMAKKVDNFLDPQPLINYYKNDAQY